MRYLLLMSFTIFVSCNFCTSHENKNDTIVKGIYIDSIVVKKEEREMILFSQHKVVKSYKIALGKNPVGKKQFEGDMKTPEGLYFIDAKSAYSKFHKNLNVSYPNAQDIEYATSQGKKAGGEIKIHGLPNNCNENNYIRYDWTWGCIALTNSEIDELYNHIKMGCKILILP